MKHMTFVNNNFCVSGSIFLSRMPLIYSLVISKQGTPNIPEDTFNIFLAIIMDC